MSARAAIKEQLEDDSTLLNIATGGIWDYDETGRLGLSRQTTPDAYDGTTGILRPSIVIKSRGERPYGDIADDAAQVLSTSEIIEVWYYEDEGYESIATMRSRVFGLLHGRQITGAFVARWIGNPFAQMRDDELGNISVERDDFQVVALKS